MLQDGFVRICINDPQPAVQHQEFTFFKQFLGQAHTENCWNAKAAGQDCGVAVWAAVFGDDARDAAFMQDGKLARSQLGSDQQCFGQTVRDVLKRLFSGFLIQFALNQAHHLGNVLTARTDVIIVHAPEFSQNFFELGLKGPFSITQFLADVVLGRLLDFRITQHHHVSLDNFTR